MLLFRYFWKPVVWALTILVLCILPGSTFDSVKTFQHTDKLIHFFLYFVQALLLFVALYKWGKIKLHQTYITILLIPSLMGMLIETIQHYLVLNRMFDLGDAAANLLGISLFLLIPKHLWIKYQHLL
jgi:VanZ family protein